MKTIYSDNTVLTKDKPFTYLASDATSGAGSITVQSILGFHSLGTSSGQIVCIGEIGDEKTEILKTSSTTGPSGTTVTLGTNLTFGHPQDTKVSIIDWDRVDIQWSATAGGAKSTIKAYPHYIQPDLAETPYNDSLKSSGYYFIRFNETIGDTNSDWSDPVPYAGYSNNTVYSIKERALAKINETKDTNLITDDFLNEVLWEARREYHNAPGRRPFRRKFGVSIGTVATGMNKVALPTDVQGPYTAENVYGVRIGTQENMSYYDKKRFDDDYEGVAHGALTTAYTVGDQDLYVDNTRDFEDSGSVTVEDDSIAYSARGLGGTLRISTAGSHAHASGKDVWQGESMGLPQNFTVYMETDGTAYIFFSSPISTVYVGQNVFADYYRTLVSYDSDADELDEPDYDMFVPYLAFRVKNRKANGTLPLTDPDYQEWMLRKGNALQNEYSGTEVRLSPGIDHLPMPG